jgi:hypothetical protein
VRQSDAHAWAEVWIAGQGWMRVDPTSAVAPARTGTLQRLLPPRSVIAQALGAMSPGFEVNLRAFWEATNNRWNQWVLNYSQDKQLNLLRNIGFASPSWEDLGTLLLGLVIAVSLIAAAWAQWERHRQDPWLRLLHMAAAKLQKAGLRVGPHTSPRQMATLLQGMQAQPSNTAEAAQQLQAIQHWLLRLEAWRYAPSGAGAQDVRPALGTLQRELRQLSWPQQLNP